MVLFFLPMQIYGKSFKLPKIVCKKQKNTFFFSFFIWLFEINSFFTIYHQKYVKKRGVEIYTPPEKDLKTMVMLFWLCFRMFPHLRLF